MAHFLTYSDFGPVRVQLYVIISFEMACPFRLLHDPCVAFDFWTFDLHKHLHSVYRCTMARNIVNIVWFILDAYLIFYLLFFYRKTRNWSYLLLSLIILSLMPFSIMRVLSIPVAPLMISLGWWRYVLLGLEIVGMVLVEAKFISDLIRGRPW